MFTLVQFFCMFRLLCYKEKAGGGLRTSKACTSSEAHRFPLTREKDMNIPESMIRLTTQRQILLEELSKVNSHPTACELYDIIKKRLPRIGLGTVYRNLELMADSGMILKLELGGAQKRFDATIDPHYHIRCSICGKLEDITVDVQEKITTHAAEKTSYNILGHNVEFTGECPACQEAEEVKITEARREEAKIRAADPA
jgi:Fur family ferric uptake transcriptional regulator